MSSAYRSFRTFTHDNYFNYATTPRRNVGREKPILTGNSNAVGTESTTAKDALLISVSMLISASDDAYMTTSSLESDDANNKFSWYDSTLTEHPKENCDIYILVGYAAYFDQKDSNGNPLLVIYGYNHGNGLPAGYTITNRRGTWVRTVASNPGTQPFTQAYQAVSHYRYVPITESALPGFSGAEGISVYEPVYMKATNPVASGAHAPGIKPPSFFVMNFMENYYNENDFRSGLDTLDSGSLRLRYEQVIMIHYHNRSSNPGINWTIMGVHLLKDRNGTVRPYKMAFEGQGGPATTVNVDVNHQEAMNSGLNPYEVEHDFIVAPNSSVKVVNNFANSSQLAAYTGGTTPWVNYLFERGGTQTDVDSIPGRDIADGFIIKPLHPGEHFRVDQKFGYLTRGGVEKRYHFRHRGFALAAEATQKRNAQWQGSSWGDGITEMVTNKAEFNNIVCTRDDYVSVKLYIRGMPDNLEDNSNYRKSGTPIIETGTGYQNCILLDSHASFGDLTLGSTDNNNTIISEPIRILPDRDAETWSAQFYVRVASASYHRVHLSGSHVPDYGLQVFAEDGRSRLNTGTRNIKLLYSASGNGTSTIGTATVPELAGLANDGSWGYSICTNGCKVEASFNYVNNSVDIIDTDLGNFSGQARGYMPQDDGWHLMIFRK